ncbi:MAG TPA: DUF2993 domain-containing protein [Candidatus Stackebrandtia faecavium]|nr:DUF2993 domain-containing protein [Candidatus Stackebrandtia faecavium]
MAKSKRKKWIGWLVALVVVLALVILGDRIAANVAENKVAAMVANEAASHGVSSESEPEVDIKGVPFLTQFIGSNYQQIDVTLPDVSSEELQLEKVDISVKGVDAPASAVLNGDGEVVAETVDAVVHMGYDELERILGETVAEVVDVSVESVDDNVLTVAISLETQGQTLELTGELEVTIPGDTLRVAPKNFELGDGAGFPGSDMLVSQVMSAFEMSLALPQMPYDLQLEDPSFGEDSIRIGGTSKNVQLS